MTSGPFQFAGAKFRRACAAALTVVLAACGTWQPSRDGAAPPRAPDKPDDSDVAALIPIGLETVIDIDMARLRDSAWTAPLLEPVRTDPERRQKVQALGFDDIQDVDRIVYAVTSAGPAVPTLVIGQGRLEPGRLEESFRNRWPDVRSEPWRGVVVWLSGENAMAVITNRTFASGPPATVRAVIDCAWHAAAALPTDPQLGPARRALSGALPGKAAPVLLLTTKVTPELRARAGNAWRIPAELRVVGVRVDAGQTLDVDAIGFLDHPQAARALASRLTSLMNDRILRLAARAAGFLPVIDATRITAEGGRTRATASIAPEQRADLVARLRPFAEMLATPR